MKSKNKLLVEGEADRGFFEALTQSWGVSLETVDICTPRSVGAHDSKQGVLQALPIYLAQMNDGQIERLGMVMDADSDATGGLGYTRTRQQLIDRLDPLGFTLKESPAPGLLFEHADGLKPVGAWIMPNNTDDGMLEDWVRACIAPNESTLFAHAQAAIRGIPGGAKFRPIHLSKAEVATWLAWQAKPEHGLYQAAQTEGLLDPHAPWLIGLRRWLERIF